MVETLWDVSNVEEKDKNEAGMLFDIMEVKDFANFQERIPASPRHSASLAAPKFMNQQS